MVNNQQELGLKISKIQPYLNGVEPVNIFINQFQNIEEYAKMAARENIFSSLNKSLKETLPKNTWVKVNLKGEELGVINFRNEYAVWLYSGFFIRKVEN